MLCNGWRTLVVEKPSELSLCKNCIVINGNPENTFPIGQIRNIIITTPYGSLSLPLLNELSNNSINVLVCDEKRTPHYEMVNIGNQYNVASAIINQSRWSEERKGIVWQHIVRNKIRLQKELLSRLKKTVPEVLYEYMKNVKLNDEDNREGQAARFYFPALLGKGFRRMAPDAVNAGLNYGYTILRTSLDRIITSYGYHTALGINHCSMANRFNLSCDIMEPFRPFVDKIVSMNVNTALNADYKAILVGVLQSNCRYKNMKLNIEQAMSIYTKDIIEFLNQGVWDIGEVDFL